MVDKLHYDPINQSGQVQILANDIRRKEGEEGHSNTVLIGDFNINPFESAMNLATGLNAMMTKKCVKSGARTLLKTKYQFFYNPMWSFFGDRTPEPPGTYYHANSSQGHYGWNLLDQVLIRPSVVKRFDQVKIVTQAGKTNLQTREGRPNKRIASDHFPILLTLK